VQHAAHNAILIKLNRENKVFGSFICFP
jgi:hypothetical protein